MANASLQIGNGNWAIKEDNLLGYSKAGTRFLPIPITMTRATLGTRVNPSGLIEDVELLGIEKVENGDGSSTTGWDLAYANTTLSLNNNNLRATANASGAYGLSQDLSLDTSKQYIIKATINVDNASGGAANLRIATNPNLSSGVTTLSSTTGTTTTILSPSAATMYIGIVDTANDSSNYVEIDNISVKEVTRDGLARVDYTDGTASLLVEPQRTNILPYSEDFSTYTPVGGIVVEGNQTDPNGNNTAYKLSNFSANNSRLDGNTSTTAVNGVTYTYSAYYKGSGTIRINCGTSTGVGGSSEKDIILTNEWTRQQVTFTASSPTGVVKTHAAITRTPNNDAIVYLAFAQIEEGSYPTSYIKTTGSTVTRNQDEYTKTGISDKINSEEGVLFLEAKTPDTSVVPVISISDTTFNNEIEFAYYGTNQWNFVVRAGGSSNFVAGTTNENTFSKFAISYTLSSYKVYKDGVLIGSGTMASALSGLSVLDFAYPNNTNLFYGNVRQLQVFKTALSDSELATLTT